MMQKDWKSYIYLGFDRADIHRCRYHMDKDNLMTLRLVSLLLIAILVIITSFYMVFDNDLTRDLICLSSGAMMLFVFLLSGRMLKRLDQVSSQMVDLLIDFFTMMCFAVAIYLGTFAAGGNMAVAPVWMFFFVILIFNRLPVQNFIMLVLAGGAFTACSHMTKTAFIFQYDMMHMITSILGSFFMSWSKSRLKVQNILALEKLEKVNLAILETVEKQEREAVLLRTKASRDELSGFYTKQSFEDEVKGILDSDEDESCALVCMDIDNFKNINDSFGHLFGDQVLRELVQEMKTVFGDDEILGRFGGDEFIVFLRSVSSVEVLRDKLERLIGGCRKKYYLNGIEQSVSLSAGLALYPRDGRNYEDLFEKADMALYGAKRQGKGIYCLYGQTKS